MRVRIGGHLDFGDLRRDEFPSLAINSPEDDRDCFRLKSNAGLRLVVERTVETRNVEVDLDYLIPRSSTKNNDQT